MQSKEICKIKKFLFTSPEKYDRINARSQRWYFMIFENLRIKNVRSILRYKPDMKRWSAKSRKDHIIGIKLYGSALHDFGYRKFVLSGNCIFFFNQRDDYQVEVIEPCEAFSVHFTTCEEIDTDSFCIPIANTSEISALLQRAEIAQREDDQLKLLSLIYQLCGEFKRIYEKTYSSKDVRMFAAKNYMDIHFNRSDCLSKAISQSGLSARRFNDLFKSHFDTTPNRYLTLRRIEHAQAMLETKSLTVTEIAECCGFSDIYYFSKVFKQICGLPPSKWR